MSKPFSAKIVIKILCKEFGFFVASQKGSHVKLKKVINKREVVTIVSFHKELSEGTLKGILNLAQVDEKDFRGKL